MIQPVFATELIQTSQRIPVPRLHTGTTTTTHIRAGVSISLGGTDGGYFGRTGAWTTVNNCGPNTQWNATDASDVNANLNDNIGIGAAEVFLLGGPGAQPGYSASEGTNDAALWGIHQGNIAVTEWDDTAQAVSDIIWADIEQRNGWNSTWSKCDHRQISTAPVPIALDEATLSGFFYAVQVEADLDAGVYSSADLWSETFGCVQCGSGDPGNIPQSVYEWTHGNQMHNQIPSQSNEPSGWCRFNISGQQLCAPWFGDVSVDSTNAVVWQWAAYLEAANFGDLDQIDDSRLGAG